MMWIWDVLKTVILMCLSAIAIGVVVGLILCLIVVIREIINCFREV